MKKRKKVVSVLAGAMAAVMVLSLMLSLIPVSADAASSSAIKKQIAEMKNQQKDLKDQMEDVQNQYEENENEIADMVSRKNVIDQEIFLLYEQIDNINEQLAAYSILIADKQEELDEAVTRLEELSAKNKERIRAMEEDGGITYWSVLFKANSFSDLLDRLSMIDEIAAADKRRLEEMDQAADAVAAAQAELEDEKAEIELTKAELDATQAELEEKRAEADEILTELIEKGFELDELYAEYEEAEKQLLEDIAQKEKEYTAARRAEIAAAIAAAASKAAEEAAKATEGSNGGSSSGSGSENSGSNGGSTSGGTTSSGTTSSGTSSPGGSSSGSGKWLIPCAYTYVSSPFGDRDQPTAGASTNHQGIDLAAPEGTPIYASRSGVVTTATYGNTAGHYVTLNHGDGYSSIYMHMTKYTVKKGQTVTAGQVIGYVGDSGVATGFHLHFGIMKNGAYVNPAYYVSFY